MVKTEEKSESAAVKEAETAKSGNTSLIEEMFHVGAHFGYSKTRRHPSFKPIVFGAKKGVDILNLEKTGSNLLRAMEFVKDLSRAGKVILIVGTKHEARKATETAGKTLGLPFVSKRWIGGTLTNFPEVKKRVMRLISLRHDKEEGKLNVYTKKERLLLDREIARLELYFGGIVRLERVPDALFIIDPRHEKTAVREATQKEIPIVALASSDCDISTIEYPIPANDSSVGSIVFFVNKFVQAYQEGVKDRKLATDDKQPATNDKKENE